MAIAPPVHQTVAQNAAGVLSNAITIPSTAAGNMLLVTIAQTAGATGANFTLTNNGTGATWTVPASVTSITNGPPPVGFNSGSTSTCIACGYALNVAAGITQVTVNWSKTSLANVVSITEWSGVAASAAVDVSAGGGSGGVASTTYLSPSITTTNAEDLVVAAVARSASETFSAAASTPTTGWNALTGGTSTVVMAAEYNLPTATGTFRSAWTGASGQYGAIAISFKAAASGTAWTQSLADTVTATDDVVKDIKPSKSDTVTATDGLSRAWAAAKTLTDTVTLTDAFGRTWVVARSLSDTLTATDANGKKTTLGKGDTVTLSEGFTPTLTPGGGGLTLSLADTISLTDAIAKALSVVKSDTLTASDAIGKTVGLHKPDTVTLADVLGLTYGDVASGVISLTGSIAATDTWIGTLSLAGASTETHSATDSQPGYLYLTGNLISEGALMANLFVLWNYKEQRVEGIYGTSTDANNAKRRVSGKSGTKTNAQSGKDNIAASDLEVLTVTKP